MAKKPANLAKPDYDTVQPIVANQPSLVPAGTKSKANATSIGVIVGRFQVPHLHEVHEELIRLVANNHPKTIIFLGLSPCKGTKNNPLDFEARKQMILSTFPDVTVMYLMDTRSDEVWSSNLDKRLNEMMNPHDNVTLYGGRDSFLSHYKGKHKTQELESDRIISGSEIRNELSKKTKASSEFRDGVIWAVYNRYPTTYTTVDIAVFNEDYSKILLARKPDEKEYRLIGGFSTPESTSFEDDARREVMEEAKIEVSEMTYLGSFFIDDWRYRSEADKIKTILYATKYTYGRPEGADDVAEVRWTTAGEVEIVKEHQELIERAWKYAQTQKKN